MPASHILLFGALVLAALGAVFPGKRLEQLLVHSEHSDPLSIEYLKVWLRAQPSDSGVRLILARHQASVGNLASASATLAPMLTEHDVAEGYYNDAQMLWLNILMQAVWQENSHTAAYAHARAAALQQLERMGNIRWTSEQMEILAGIAVALGALDQAILFLRQRLLIEPSRALSIGNAIASLQLAQSRYRVAAATYFRNMAAAKTVDQRRQQFIKGLSALQSGNLMDAAMKAAQSHWQSLKNDARTLEYLAQLARSANRLDLAEFYVSRLLKLRAGRTVLDVSPPSS